MGAKLKIKPSSFWAGMEVPIFGKLYFDFSEIVKLTGIAGIDIRYWRTCFRKLNDRWPREKHKRLRFTADQIISFLAIHELTRSFGMTVQGAVDVLGCMDLEGFVEEKIKSGQLTFNRFDLNVLLQIQITRRAEVVFGSEEYLELKKPLQCRRMGIGKCLLVQNNLN
jgi:hypothetical protein